MKIDHYISELLFDHDCVIVTDLGGFITNYKPASINPALHVISPPSKKLAFNASLKNNDGLLANHISQRTLLNYSDACEVIRDYVKDATSGMKEGQKLRIDKVGVLYFDQEERLQFLPDHHANYLVESFGMSPVHAPVIKRTAPEPAYRETAKIRHVQSDSSQSNKKEIRIFGWKVLEMIPAAAVLAILIMTPPVLKEFNSNLSTLLPFSRMNEFLEDIKGEKQDKTTVSIPYSNPFEIPPATKNSYTAPVAVPSEVEITTEPSNTNAVPEVVPAESVSVPSPAVAKEIVKNENSATIEVGDHTFFVIGGCFRSQENAEKFVAELQSKGIQAVIIGQNKAGLHMVSLFSSRNFQEATDTLPEIKSNSVESAWIYKK